LIERWIAEREWRYVWAKLSLVTQDVLDVLDPDVSGAHDLGHSASDFVGSEQLGQEDETEAVSTQ
jgi:hypothetical protein